MLIVQIYEFELKDLDPLAVHVFMTKQKSLRQIFDWITIYC